MKTINFKSVKIKRVIIMALTLLFAVLYTPGKSQEQGGKSQARKERSQKWKKIGSLGLNFLLELPVAKENLTQAEREAIRATSSYLNWSAEQQHDLNVANQSRSQIDNRIYLETDDGRKVQLFMGEDGETLYTLYEGRVRKIGGNIMEKTRKSIYSSEIPIEATLPEYDLPLLEENYPFHLPAEYIRYYLTKKSPYISEIADYNNINREDVFLRFAIRARDKEYYFEGDYVQAISIQELNGSRLIRVRKGRYEGNCYVPGYPATTLAAVYLREQEYNKKINSFFMYKWAKDLNKNGLEFKEFRGLRRSFYKEESISVLIRYQSEVKRTLWEIEVYDYNTGVLLIFDSGNCFQKAYTKLYYLDNSFAVGKYLINLNIVKYSTKEVILNKSDVFEILEKENKK